MKCNSDGEHHQRKIDIDGASGTVLSASAAVPTFLRVSDLYSVAHQVEYIQGAVGIADPTSGTFFLVDYRWHMISFAARQSVRIVFLFPLTIKEKKQGSGGTRIQGAYTFVNPFSHSPRSKALSPSPDLFYGFRQTRLTSACRFPSRTTWSARVNAGPTSLRSTTFSP